MLARLAYTTHDSCLGGSGFWFQEDRVMLIGKATNSVCHIPGKKNNAAKWLQFSPEVGGDQSHRGPLQSSFYFPL